MKNTLLLFTLTLFLSPPATSSAQFITKDATSNGASQTVTYRDPWFWPFSEKSPWNTPIGNGAKFADPDSAIAQDVRADGARVNAGTWSHPVYLAKTTDPIIQVIDKENDRRFDIRVPEDATPDPRSDAHMYVIDPTKQISTEMFGAVRNPNGTIATVRSFQVNLYGMGWFEDDGSPDSARNLFGVRATNSSGFGGLIRVWELQKNFIHHAITFLLPSARLKHGPAWPSSREDYWGFRDYTGNVPMGTLIAIPPSVDITKLGLTASGLALAKALQDYGAYCADSGGDPYIHFSVEDAAADMPQIADLQRDIVKIRPWLLPVTNNTAATPGGGGIPREALAPPLAPQPIP